jgi:cupin fold WbuC family metalloprotein
MRTRSGGQEVLYPDEAIVRVDGRFMAELETQAKQNERRRMRLCAHESSEDLLHEMLIVLTSATYIRPHRHLDKSESFHVVKGQADVIIFHDDGTIAAVVPLGEYDSDRCFFYRYAKPSFHMLRILSPVFMFHETTNGPFRREDTEFAAWSPPLEDGPAAAEYLERVGLAVQQFLQR